MNDKDWESARLFAQQNPEMMEKLKAAGYEQLRTLGRWRSLDTVTWNALGEDLILRFRAGRPDGPDYPMDWAIPRELARELLLLLLTAFEETGGAKPPRQ